MQLCKYLSSIKFQRTSLICKEIYQRHQITMRQLYWMYFDKIGVSQLVIYTNFFVFSSENKFFKIIVFSFKPQCLQINQGTKHHEQMWIMKSIMKLGFDSFIWEAVSVRVMKFFNDISHQQKMFSGKSWCTNIKKHIS